MFYTTAAVHLTMKVLLGLVMVFEDRYGMRSMVAPPQSIVLAAVDVLVWFAACRVLDALLADRARRATETALLFALFVFLSANFVVHRYFKGFINRGLIEFNGAQAGELLDYAAARFDRYCAGFVAIAGFTGFGSAVFRETLLGQRWLRSDTLLAFVLLYATGGAWYAGRLSQGQSGFMAKDPSYELARSYFGEPSEGSPRASAAQVRRFRTPSALHGSYETQLDLALRAPSANVLFVLIESLPFEQTSLGGAPGGLPVLAELARDGISFTNFRTVFPATSRSFLTYHCGIYPNTGAATATKYSPDYDCSSFLKVLKHHGYRTGFFTAPMFGYDNLARSALLHEYDVYQDFLSLRAHAKLNGIQAPAVEEEAVADSLLRFVRSESARPYFATYFMFWDHAPYRLPFQNISNLPPLERYKRTLEYLDRVLRQVVKSVEEASKRPTIVVVAADHGEGFGLHHGNFNHVGHIYEDDVHIPFLVHMAGIGRHVSARQASNVDFAPTLTELLELPADPAWQGQDLLAPDWHPRPTLLMGRAHELTNGLVDGNWKYIEYPAAEKRMLFDLARDPLEQHDLSSARPALAKEYASLIHAWLPVAEAKAWPSVPAR